MAYYKCGGINVTSNSNAPINTANGAIASFNTNLSMPVVSTVANINPIQNGTPWIDSNEVNKVPYIKRAVAGTATRIGNHLYDKLVGGTVAFNQKVYELYGNVSTVTTNPDGTYKAMSNGTQSYFGASLRDNSGSSFKSIIGHKYYFYSRITEISCNAFKNVSFGNWQKSPRPTKTTIGEFISITESVSDTSATFLNANTEGTSLSTDYFCFTPPIIIDLTAMFGSTIADYIYSLEQATAGAGVAWFKALFPNDYYAYNAGELMSVKATAHVMRNASNTVIGNYALDSNLELRGIPKLDANNNLYYDGDECSSDGNVLRRYGIVDLGSLNWNGAVDGRIACKYDSVKLVTSSATKGNILPLYYITDTQNNVWNRTNNKTIAITNNSNSTLIIYDADLENKTANEVKTALSGKYAVYELATPTTETASPFTNPQVCDENGTEEYTDSRAVAIPVGHETYQANICEITGFDELNIQQCGVNLFKTTATSKTESGVNWVVNDDGTVSVSGNATGYTSLELGVSKINNAGVITISGIGTATNIAWNTIELRDKYNNILLAITSGSNNPAITVDISAYPTADNIRVIVKRYTNTAVNGVIKPQVEVGNQATEWQPYSGKLIKLEFDDTVYLAEVSCLNGVWKLKLLGVFETYNGTENWYSGSDTKYFALFNQTPSKSNTDMTQLCNIAVAGGGNYEDYGKFRAQTNGAIAVGNKNSDNSLNWENVTAFKAFLAETPMEICYEIATPVEITLDETDEFNTLLGVNNVWHDGNGNTEIKYRKVQ